MKRAYVGIFLLLFCSLTACSSERGEKEISMEIQQEPETGLKELEVDSSVWELSDLETELKIEEPEETFSAFGVSVLLPENPSWIKNTEYTQWDENHLEIHYYDDISGADCKLLAVRDGEPDLPEDSFDESLEESWVGESPDGESIYVKVQYSLDIKIVLATWEYENYKFALRGEINGDEDEGDAISIPKTALYIISNLADS